MSETIVKPIGSGGEGGVAMARLFLLTHQIYVMASFLDVLHEVEKD
jgi:hypothetical protein